MGNHCEPQIKTTEFNFEEKKTGFRWWPNLWTSQMKRIQISWRPWRLYQSLKFVDSSMARNPRHHRKSRQNPEMKFEQF